MKKNGFAATTIIYTFFTTFLLLLAFLLNSYARTDFIKTQIKEEIKNEPKDLSDDINLSVCIRNLNDDTCKPVNEIPKGPFKLKDYGCDNEKAQNSLTYANGRISFNADAKVTCYVELVQELLDININIFINNKDKNKNASSVSMANFEQVYTMPSKAFTYLDELTTCTTLAGGALTSPNDYKITLNETTNPREFELQTNGQIICNTYFVRKSADIELHIYKEDPNGTNLFGDSGKKYIKVNSIADIPQNYTFNKYTNRVCTPNIADEDFIYNSATREFEIYATEKTECSVYFNSPS